MVVDMCDAVSLQDLSIVRTQQARVADLNRIAKVLGELAEESVQSRAEFLARHPVPLELEQKEGGVGSAVGYSPHIDGVSLWRAEPSGGAHSFGRT